MTAPPGDGPSETAVADDAAGHRFVLRAEGGEAELVYRRDGRRLVLVHTGVPEEWSGRGLGARLVAAALERAREEGLVVVPVCSYARRWLETHPEAAAGIEIDRPTEDEDKE